MNFRSIIKLSPLWLTFTLFAHAQAVPSASEGTTNEQLLRRIEQLEQRLKEMEAREAARMSESATPAAVAAADAAVTAAPAKVASSTMASMDTATAHSAQDLNNPHLHIRGYADAGFFASTNTPDDPESNSHFALGQFNLFMTSRLSQRANVLAELVVESNAHNSVGLDLERLLFNYSIADALNVSVGRYHTAIGYYNTAYHHSGWMQTAIDRPFIFNFEDDGGILPIHNVGISLAGRIPSGGLGLHYIAEIGNGRTSRTRFDEAVQTSVDENGHKSFNLALSVHPEKWYGLQAGVSFYSDRLTPGAGTLLENPSNPFPTDVAARPRIDERIFSAYAVYQNTRFEFLNEALLLQHHLDGYRTFDTPGFYTQISNRFGSWRPYVRFQYVNANRYEPVFGDAGLRYGPSAGIRFDFNEFAAFKVQYDRTMLRDESSRNGVGTQVAFTF